MDLKRLKNLEEKKEKIWNLFFVKILSTSDTDHVYSLDEIPHEDEREGSSIWLDIDLIELVENVMNSNLKELILIRERAKLFYDFEAYQNIHPHVLKELKRLRKKVTKPQLARYIELCMIPDAEKIQIIEKELRSNLRAIIQNRDSFLLPNCDHNRNEFSKIIATEWNYLKTVVSEEEIIKYAVMIQKPENDQIIL